MSYSYQEISVFYCSNPNLRVCWPEPQKDDVKSSQLLNSCTTFWSTVLYNGVSITAESGMAWPSWWHSQCEKDFAPDQELIFFSHWERTNTYKNPNQFNWRIWYCWLEGSSGLYSNVFLKAGSVVRSDQVSQGFIQSDLGNTQRRRKTAQPLWMTCWTWLSSEGRIVFLLSSLNYFCFNLCV